MSGNIPSSNILLNILAKGNASGVATIAINRPGKPQCDVFDFFISLHSFATSMGEVLIFVRSVNISSFGVSEGTKSSLPGTVAFEAKNSLKILHCSCASVTTLSPSKIGGTVATFCVFINLLKIVNFFTNHHEAQIVESNDDGEECLSDREILLCLKLGSVLATSLFSVSKKSPLGGTCRGMRQLML